MQHSMPWPLKGRGALGADMLSLRRPTGQLAVWAIQGPDTQKHLSSTYLSAVHVTAVKTTYFIQSVYSKLRLSWLWHTFNLNSKSTQ